MYDVDSRADSFIRFGLILVTFFAGINAEFWLQLTNKQTKNTRKTKQKQNKC